MHIGIVAGETSGDLLGAGLIEAIRQLEPTATFTGVAGPRMQAAGCEAWEDSEALAVMGLVEPLKELPRLLRLRRMLVERWSTSPPDVFVGIDSPEFNLGVAGRLKAAGIRTVQYVSPQVWAWRQRRVQKIGRAVDCVLCLLPFEKTFYDRHDVNAVVVGHPLADNQPEYADRSAARAALGLDIELDATQVVTVMPGSRRGEVARLGPVFARTVAVLATRQQLAFVAPMANASARRVFAAALSEHAPGVDVMLIDGNAPRAIVAADVVLLASGTASLQTALLQRSMVSAYRVAAGTYYLARALRLLKVPHFTMPNLLTEEPLVPEFLQYAATPAALANAVGELLSDEPRRRNIEATFGDLRGQLGLGASDRAAEAVLEVARAGDAPVRR